MKLLLVLISTLSILTLTSCLKLPKLEEDEGPAVSLAEFQNAILKGFGNPDQSQLKRNEFVEFEKTVGVVGGKPQLLLTEAQQIVAFKDDLGSNTRIFQLLTMTLEHQEDGNSKQSTKQDEIYSNIPANLLMKLFPNSTFQTKSATSENYSFNAFLILMLATCSPQGNFKPSCHNLTVTETTEDLPPKVPRPGCEGIAGCKIRVVNISFNQILKHIDPDKGVEVKEKYFYRIKFAPELPFLSRVLSNCFQGLFNSGQTPFVAEVCTYVTGFLKGSDTP